MKKSNNKKSNNKKRTLMKVNSKNLNIKKIGIFIGGILLLIFLLVVIFNDSKEQKLEKEMTRLVTEYYEDNIKGKVIGVNRHEITIKALKEKGLINIDKLKSCDEEESKSYVIVENPHETDSTKIRYTIENHMKCDKYETKQE